MAATIRLEPEEITERLGIAFSESHDELDYLRAAVVEMPSGEKAAFVRHLNCPAPGTEIWREESFPTPAPLEEVFDGFALRSDEILWTHPDVR